MAIDQYQPELAKRRMSFEIAYEQLQEAMSRAYNDLINEDQSRETRITLEESEEAVKDFLEMASSAAEWLNTKVKEAEASKDDTEAGGGSEDSSWPP